MSSTTFTTIMYHYVRDLQRSRYPGIKGRTVETFKGQIEYIKRHYHVLTMEECVAGLSGTAELPSNGILLTFDDGLLDHYTVVFPILFNEGLSGVFYPPGQAIAEGKVLNVHKIHFILASIEDVGALIESALACVDRERDRGDEEIPSNELLWEQLAEATRLDTKEIMFVKRLLQYGLPEASRARITDELFKQHVTSDEVAFAAELYMSPDQMRAMSSCGMSFGSHGWRHDWLNTLTEQEQAEDIDRSIDFLKQADIWTSDWSMSYPHGGHNETTIDLLRSRGCQMAFTVEVKLSDPQQDGPFRLARLDTNDLPTTADAEPQQTW